MQPKKKTAERKAPRKISKTYLENAALYYLQRFATSAANFRRVMMRKIQRSCKHHGQNPEDFAPILDDMIERYIATGLLNDQVFARAKTSTLRRQGKSKQAIHAKLQAKGLSKTDIGDALVITDDEKPDPEFTAALRLAQKKRLGPFRTKEADPKKEMAAMGRAGFSFDIAKRVLNYTAEGDDIT